MLLFVSFNANAQQESIIKVDSGNKNTITIQQTGSDSFQKSNIQLKNSDSNKMEVTQYKKDTIVAKQEKTSDFMEFITNTNTIISLLISIPTLIALCWKGIPYLNRLKREK